MVRITDVNINSIASKSGIIPEDILVSINGHEINDVLDYRFYLTESEITLKIKRNSENTGNFLTMEIKKDEYADIGLEFETPLMDKKHRCENKCIFCFIDQLPDGMRDSLYFKDDDSRLSFLHGNYITMTNLTDSDIDRIIEMHISPVNISVHTTDPELRCFMMKNKRAGDSLKYLKRLADSGCELRCQIVLCKNVNDGSRLDKTMRDLSALFSSVRSVSIVPAGLTAYRENLYPLDRFTKDDCRGVIKQVSEFAAECMKKYGSSLFFCSDEFYVQGEINTPGDEYYEEYSQIENGVGMLTSFEVSVNRALEQLTGEEKLICRNISIATGEAAYEFISKLVEKITEICYNIKCSVYSIKNEFFGEYITVSGLLTGKDIRSQLYNHDLGDELLISRSMLRNDGDLFLCGMTPNELSEALKCKIKTVENDGEDFILSVLGII